MCDHISQSTSENTICDVVVYLSVERAERTGCDGLSLRKPVYRSPLAVKLGNQQKPQSLRTTGNTQ